MSVKCLIIAAGKGTRLQLRGNSKPLVPVLGMPLIERVIRCNHEAGVTEFYVVVGYQGKQVRTFLKDLSREMKVSITPIDNNDWEKENGISVLVARDHLNEPFLLMMSDHIFDPKIVQQMLDHPPTEGGIALGVDRDLNNPSVDIQDVTRVMTEKDKVCGIGKGLDDYNGFDTGIFYCSPGIFDAIDRSQRDNNDTSLSGGVRILAGEGRVDAVDICGYFWVDVDDPAAIRKAEDLLLNRLQAETRNG